jgi:hypothetical protein
MCRHDRSFPVAGSVAVGASGETPRLPVPSCGMVWFRPHDADASDPRLRAVGALRVLAPAGLAAAAIMAFAPWATWVIFAFGWMLFPAVGQLVGGISEVGRRAAVGVTPLVVRESSRVLAEGAEVLRSVAALHRVSRGLASIPDGPARRNAEAVATAATKLASAPADPVTRRVVRGVFVEPTADVLAGYGRLAGTVPSELRPELESMAADFPRLADKLEEIAAELGTESFPPPRPSTPAGVARINGG